MTTYDALGLPIFDATDKIAAGDDGLRQDLNLIGATAGTAIVTEGVRAEGAAVASAAGYTDSKDTSNRAAWAAADVVKLDEAKAYADTKKTEAIGAAATDATTKANTAQANAKAYADSTFVPAWQTADLITNGSFRDGLTGWTNTGAWVVQTSANGVTSWARTMSGGDGAFAQSIVVPASLQGKTLRLKVLAMTTSAGTLLTRITTTAGATSQEHTLTTSYVERTLDVGIPAGQGATPITLNVGRASGTVYMTAIRLESI